MVDLDRALLDPAAVFRTPWDVVEHEALDRTQKIEILRRWGYDVREQQVAEEENMPGDSGQRLDEILGALHALGAEPDLEHVPPTKQGG